ncbi:thioredoxin [Aeromonas phage Riv-10]|uniref:Thioredoxin n=2 Tax=Biquartavirus 44RR2 TaxID=115987 RepID=Q6U9P2_9CAUD|nr:NrdC-like thioredoxin [Aeromonas phage 44RR2.8t]AAQ81379.1 hypothetical protein [Aeromonas phage 44RR2.8t]APU00533.1 thioredoxin [Aeromonas phage 44RR2.8t.2]APU02115.1 thioredoxin [Aeromonas phage Riv-10]
MDIELHNEAQKQIRDMEWAIRSANIAKFRELRISEKSVSDAISNYHLSNEYDEILARRKAVADQHFKCPLCDTEQIQLVSWQHKVVDLRCRRCKHKFIWESPV